MAGVYGNSNSKSEEPAKTPRRQGRRQKGKRLNHRDTEDTEAGEEKKVTDEDHSFISISVISVSPWLILFSALLGVFLGDLASWRALPVRYSHV
jgi:hypothetical protein